jgi:[CysO sulfur-carrier protein]-S-L-cysteine hydrolase
VKSPALILTPAQLQEIEAHLNACLPNEGCGLLAGKENRCRAVIPITNAHASPVRFLMQPEEQLKAFQWIEDNGLELLAMFHSHPTGPPGPSETDLKEFYYPDIVSIICMPLQDRWEIHAFELNKNNFKEVYLAVIEGH